MLKKSLFTKIAHSGLSPKQMEVSVGSMNPAGYDDTMKLYPLVLHKHVSVQCQLTSLN